MKKIFITAAVLSNLIFAHAQIFEANLDGLQRVPPNASPAFGTGQFTLTGGLVLTVDSGSYQDLLGGASAVTLNEGTPGNDGPLVFNLTLDTPGAATGTFSGFGNLTFAQVQALNAGNLYINIRSSVFPSGEIRGQLQPVPEPMTMALFGLGGLALLAVHRRKL